MSTSPPLVVADRYRLVAPLGQGGMGRVWRATDVVLHRDVAIKELVPPPGLTPDERREMRERSLREARAIARLNNINVVRVFDVLRTDADPWIVMEYVPSRSLQDILASDGPFNPVRAAEIGLGVLGALRAAHRAGVVHRDVKPGNVLIGEDGRVVLTDFGLATVPGDPNVTRTGLVLGSPAYIAPERARDGTAGPGADLWSLGATLYAAVEGASPFARPSAIATLAALATENPPPARNAGPLKPVLNGLLRKDPAHRINADEAERLLLRAAGRRSKITFPMSPSMRRPGVGRERPPVVPGVSASAPVVPGPRPPVTSGPGTAPVSPGRSGVPPISPGRSGAPPVTTGRAAATPPPTAPGRAAPTPPGRGAPPPPVTPGRPAATPPGRAGGTPPGRTATPPAAPGHPAIDPAAAQNRPQSGAPAGRAPIFAPGKATVGRAPRPADTPTRIDAPHQPDLDATRVDGPAALKSTGTAKPPPPQATPGAERGTALDATMRGSGSAPGSFTVEEVAAARKRATTPQPPSSRTPAVTPPPSTPSRDVPQPSQATAATATPTTPATKAPAPPANKPTAAPTTPASAEPTTTPTSTGPGPAASPAASPESAVPASAAPASAAPASAAPASAAPGSATSASTAAPAEPASRQPFGPRPTKSATTAADAAAPAEDTASSSPEPLSTQKDEPSKAAAPADETDKPEPEAEAETKSDASVKAASTDADAEAVAGTTTGTEAVSTPPKSGSPKPESEASDGDPKAADPSAVAADAAVESKTGEASTTEDAPAPTTAKPVVGARAGTASASKASRKKGRGRQAKVPPADTKKPVATAAEAPDAQPVSADEPASIESPSIPAATAQAAVETTEPATADETKLDAGTAGSGQGAAAAEKRHTEPTKSELKPVPEPEKAAVEPVPEPEKAAVEPVTDPEKAQATQSAGRKPEPAKAEPAKAEPAKAETLKSDVVTPGAAKPAKEADKTATGPTGGEPSRTRVIPAAGSMPSRRSQRAAAEAAKGGVAASAAPVSGASGVLPSSRPAWQPMNFREPSAGRRGLTVFGVTLTRRQTVIALAILAAVLMLVVLVPLAFAGGDDDQAAEPGRQGGAAPAASGGKPQSAAAAAPQKTTPAAKPSTTPPSAPPSSPAGDKVVVPKGWKVYGNAGTGFSVPLPAGVSVRVNGPEETEFRFNNRLLLIAQTDQPAADPMADWKQQEATRSNGKYRNYQRIKMVPVDYFQKGVDWEFLYTTSGGNRQHAVKRNFLTGPKQAYSINWYTTPEDWDAAKKDLQVIYDGFKPLS